MANTALCISVALGELSARPVGSRWPAESLLTGIGGRPFGWLRGKLLPLLEVQESSGKEDEESGEVIDSELDRKPLP